MKTFVLLALLLPILHSVTIAQKYHQPHELVEIIEKSKISYGMNLSKSDIPAENFDENLVLAGIYLDTDEDGKVFLANSAKKFAENPEVSATLRKGDEAFAANDMLTAREHYKKVLELVPDNSLITTYIGQTYEHEKNYDEAIEWLRKAVEINPIDYMAHWFLADNYAEKDEMKLAMHHITMAHLLNRNNPRLMLSLMKIYTANGTPFDDWSFRPRCAVDTTAEGKPLITIDKNNMEWTVYAMCKALWRFEPGYPETVLDGSSEPDFIIAEKEALFSLALGSVNKNGEEHAADAAINVLIQAIRDSMFENFLYYEVILRRYPSIALLIPEENRQGFAAYIMKYHTKQ